MIKICTNVTGVGDYFYKGGGTMKAVQVAATSTYAASLSVSINEGLSYSSVCDFATSDLLVLTPITDAWYKFSITANAGSITTVIA